MRYWLLRCDAAVYGMERLMKQQNKIVHWDSDLSPTTNAVLREMSSRDRVLLLCTAPGSSGAITGELQVTKGPLPDPRQSDPHSRYFRGPTEDQPWVIVPLKYSRKFTCPVDWAPLAASNDPKLNELPNLSLAPTQQHAFPLLESHHRVILLLQRSPGALSPIGCGAGASNDSASPSRERIMSPTIPTEDLQLAEELGSGQFGKVYRAMFRHHAVAVKVLNVSPADLNESELASVKLEVDILQNTHCPHIIKFYGASITPENISIVTELLPKGELGKLLLDETIPLDLFMQLRMAWDIAVGMNWLHSSKPVQFLHRDLKPSNLLVDDNHRIKICDFGFCELKDPQLQKLENRRAVGTLMYMAPEILRQEDFSEKIDVYSFGLILWEIMTRKPLYPELGPRDGGKLKSMVLAKHRPVVPSGIPEGLQELIRTCWDDSPDVRPSFDQVAVQLTDIMMEQMVADPLGRDFWRKLHMYGVDEVEWSVFEEALREEIDEAYQNQLQELPEAPTVAQLVGASDVQLHFFVASNPPNKHGAAKAELQRRYGKAVVPYEEEDLDLEITCLRRLLQVDPRGKVGLTQWGDLLRWFGPLFDEATGFPTFLQRIKKVMQLPYFFGPFSESDAQKVLRNTEDKMFLVRFSGKPGFFSVSYKKQGTVTNRRIQFNHNGDSQFILMKRAFYSLEAAMAFLVAEGIIGAGFPSPTYSDLFMTSLSNGYLMDSTEMSLEDLMEQ